MLRALLLLAVLLTLPLAGCLEDAQVVARLDETRVRLDEAQGALAEMSAEKRAWRDAAAALENESALARAQRDDAMGLLDVSQTTLAQREAELTQARESVADLEARVALEGSADSIARELADARADLSRAQALYQAALARQFRTLTSVERGNVTWQFTDLRGDTRQWQYSMEDYRADVKRVRPGDHLVMETQGGRGIRVPNPLPYVEAKPFVPHVVDITDGRSAQDFVREVFHLKSQLVDYSFSLVDEKGYYKYPGETLVEGTGICGDTTILLASILQAGNAQAAYGMEIAVWIVQWDLASGRLVQDPETVNHALIEVAFADGTVWYVETTSYDFMLHDKAYGWRYPLA